MPQAKHILPVIVFSQFCCTSLWFAGNAVMNELLRDFQLPVSALGALTSAVQLGFITGTLFFAFLSIADRFSPSRVFFSCALIGALFNLGMILQGNSYESLLLLRLITGFSLAGIYPVGMKIAADHFHEGLGTSLGYLVGALVLGTAFPHLLRELTGAGGLPWRLVLIITSSLAALGGVLVLTLIPDGPYRKPMLKKEFKAFFDVFKDRDFRAAAFGYFGHMWELYAFWAFIPIVLSAYQLLHPETDFNIPLRSFTVIGSGAIACVLGGYISLRTGTKKTASAALLLSGLCCLASPLVFLQDSEGLLLTFLIFWGLVVVADSPLFSTLVARNAPAESRGTALTIVNCLGFAITIFSIQLLSLLFGQINPAYLLMVLGVGPALGLLGLYRNNSRN